MPSTTSSRRPTWLSIDFTGASESTATGMIRLLLGVSGALFVIGLFELAFGAEARPWVLPLGSASLGAWCGWMLWKGRPRPIRVLLFASLYSVAYIIDSASHTETGDLTDVTPIVILTMVAAILANIAARRTRLLLAWLAMIGISVVIIQIAADNNPTAVFTETATTLVVVALALFMISEAHKSLDVSKRRYSRLLEEAPLGVLEMDVSATRALLDDLDLTTPQLRARLQSDDELADRLTRTIKGLQINGQVVSLMNAANAEHAGKRLQRGGSLPAARDFLERFIVGTVVEGRDGEFVLPLGRSEFALARWWLHRPGGNRLTALLVDITDQKRTEQSLEGEIDSKNRFIASVSHELRTPLTAVVGLVEELVNDRGHVTDAERTELLEIVARQSRDVAGIVEDLLVAARAESDELTIATENVNLDELIHGIMPTYGAEVAYEGTPGLVAIGDPGRIRQVLRNLLTNADRYGGADRRLSARLEGDRVEVEVRDSGTEIPAAQVARMFEPYQRAHQRPGRPDSVGLGLTVSRDLARMMGGDLTYHHDGTESVFHLDLPAARRMSTT